MKICYGFSPGGFGVGVENKWVQASSRNVGHFACAPRGWLCCRITFEAAEKNQLEAAEQIVLQPGVMALTCISFALSVIMTVGNEHSLHLSWIYNACRSGTFWHRAFFSEKGKVSWTISSVLIQPRCMQTG